MTKEEIVTAMEKAATSSYHNVDMRNRTPKQQAYLDGLTEKLAASMEKESFIFGGAGIAAALAAYSLYSGGKALHSAYKGNWGDAGLNALGAIPGVGILGKGLGWGAKALAGAGTGAKALGAAGKMTGAGKKMVDWASGGSRLARLGGAGGALSAPGKTLAGYYVAPQLVGKGIEAYTNNAAQKAQAAQQANQRQNIQNPNNMRSIGDYG